MQFCPPSNASLGQSQVYLMVGYNFVSFALDYLMLFQGFIHTWVCWWSSWRQRFPTSSEAVRSWSASSLLFHGPECGWGHRCHSERKCLAVYQSQLWSKRRDTEGIVYSYWTLMLPNALQWTFCDEHISLFVVDCKWQTKDWLLCH